MARPACGKTNNCIVYHFSDVFYTSIYSLVQYENDENTGLSDGSIYSAYSLIHTGLFAMPSNGPVVFLSCLFVLFGCFCVILFFKHRSRC